MLRVWKSVLAGLLALVACGAAGEAVAGLLPPSEQNRLIRILDRRPIVFFVAKGPADSCGKGCSEWIAAVGSFDSDAPQRFRELIEKLDGRNLPVFFHSPGGLVGAGVRLGSILRERRMTAGIGRTEARCEVFDKKDKVCQGKIKAADAIPARLTMDNGSCLSACVEAFVGASSRSVARGTYLGVHAAHQDYSQKDAQILLGKAGIKPPAFSFTNFREAARRYYVEMGVDPGLPDFASKVSHERIYILDRSEITRFGLETRSNSYETPWATSNLPGTAFVVMKSVTRRTSSAENLTTRLTFICSSGGKTLIGYRRDLPRDSDQATTFIRLSFDHWFVELSVIKTQEGEETGGFVSDLYQETLTKFAAAKTLIVTEKMKTGAQKIIEDSYSNAGLAEALREFQNRCVAGNMALRDLPAVRPQWEPMKPTPVKPVSVKPAKRVGASP